MMQMLLPWLIRRSAVRRPSVSLTFRARVRIVETVGFGILTVALYLMWPPLGWLFVAAVVIAYALVMRGPRREE